MVGRGKRPGSAQRLTAHLTAIKICCLMLFIISYLCSLMLLIIVQNLDYLFFVLPFLSFIVRFCGAN